ncbi:SEC-C metal-binding domain-containing protein, partial [Burkholderia pseudomallei]|uniref:SEC-C metal-binding domain-containing protein n=1 Tax=Burkholderia pseudomallei TaxID=28450 RepID=UPI0011787C16
VEFQHADFAAATAGGAVVADATAEMVGHAMSHSGPAGEGPRVGRNDPCPCGSGKKYKHCHGKLN